MHINIRSQDTSTQTIPTTPSHWSIQKKLSVESKCFERGVNEVIYIQTLNPSLNRDGVRYNLPPIWNNIVKERLTEISERIPVHL